LSGFQGALLQHSPASFLFIPSTASISRCNFRHSRILSSLPSPARPQESPPITIAESDSQVYSVYKRRCHMMFAPSENVVLQHPSTTTSTAPTESSASYNHETVHPKWVSTETFGNWLSSWRSRSTRPVDVESGVLTERQKKYLARIEIHDTNVRKRESLTLLN
jgi:hypothetical protein